MVSFGKKATAARSTRTYLNLVITLIAAFTMVCSICFGQALLAYAEESTAQEQELVDTENGENTEDEASSDEDAEDNGSDEGTSQENGAEDTETPGDGEQTSEEDQAPVLKDANGDPITGEGWHLLNGKWYLTDAEGHVLTGFQTYNGVTYYLAPTDGAMLTGWQEIDGAWHCFDGSGAMKTGWFNPGGAWYYLNASDGSMATDLTAIGGQTYLFGGKADGSMKWGWQKIDGNWRYFGEANDGAMKKGWVKPGSSWYYLSPETGDMVSGLNDINGNTYLFAGPDDGSMQYGWQYMDEKWYHFGGPDDGAMKRGWVLDGPWYYLDPEDGVMVSDTMLNINGALYAFKESGAMRANELLKVKGNECGYAAKSGAITTIGEYVNDAILFKPGETVLTGWQWFSDSWFYGNGDGYLHTGWLKDNGKWYYLIPGAGTMATGSVWINGKSEYFYDNGVWDDERSRLCDRAQGFSSRTGYLILVDVSACRIGVFQGSKGNWNLIRYEKCVCGAPGSSTIRGTYSTGYHLGSLPSYPNAKYCTNISGGYFFHSILNSTSELGYHLSHGCVRLNWPTAQYIQSLPYGTTVNLF